MRQNTHTNLITMLHIATGKCFSVIRSQLYAENFDILQNKWKFIVIDFFSFPLALLINKMAVPMECQF